MSSSLWHPAAAGLSHAPAPPLAHTIWESASHQWTATICMMMFLLPACNAFWCRKLFLPLYFSLVSWRTHSGSTGIDISACYPFIDIGEKQTPSALSSFALYRDKALPPLQMWFWSAKSLPTHDPESSSRLWGQLQAASCCFWSFPLLLHGTGVMLARFTAAWPALTSSCG